MMRRVAILLFVVGLACDGFGAAQYSNVLTYPRFKAFDPITNEPLVGGKLYSYKAGSSATQALFTSASLATQHAWPVVLNSAGEAILYGSGMYDLTLKKSNGTTLWTASSIFCPTFSTFMLNFMDSATAAEGREALELGTAATYDVGTTSGTIPVLGEGGVLDATMTGAGGGITSASLTGFIDYHMPRGHIAGLQINCIASATTIFSVSPGECRDITNATDMTLSSAIYKNIATTWSAGGTTAGNAAGGYIGHSSPNVPANASKWFWVWLIKDSTNSVTDVGVWEAVAHSPVDCTFRTSANYFPSSYTWARRIGAFRTDSSGNIMKFFQFGDEFSFKNVQAESSVSTNSSASKTLSYACPGIQPTVETFISATSSGAGGPAVISSAVLSPDVSLGDSVTLTLNGDGYRTFGIDTGENNIGNGDVYGIASPVTIRPDKHSRINVACESGSDISVTLYISVLRWIDLRESHL